MANNLREKYPGISLTMQEEASVGGSLNKNLERWNMRAVCSGERVNMIILPNGNVMLCD